MSCQSVQIGVQNQQGIGHTVPISVCFRLAYVY